VLRNLHQSLCRTLVEGQRIIRPDHGDESANHIKCVGLALERLEGWCNIFCTLDFKFDDLEE
jgi:hypothetical protein